MTCPQLARLLALLARPDTLLARPHTAGRGDLGREAGAGGQRVPATRVLPGHVLAAPSRAHITTLSPTLPRASGRTRGRLRASPGSSRCFPRPPAPAPRTTIVCAPLVTHAPAIPSPHIPRPRPRATHTRDTSSPALQSPHIPRPRPRAPHTRDTTVPPFPRTIANTHAVRHPSVSTSTDILRTGADAVAARSGAPTISARGARGRRAREQREDPGLARRRPLGPRSLPSSVAETSLSFRTDGAASTCPGRTRVAGPHRRRPPLPGPCRLAPRCPPTPKPTLTSTPTPKPKPTLKPRTLQA